VGELLTKLRQQGLLKLHLSMRDGTFRDLSGNGNHGTPSGAEIRKSENGFSGWFDGVNDFVNLGDHLDPLTEDFTLLCWIKTRVIGHAGLMSKEAAAQTDRFYMGLDAVGALMGFFRVDGTSEFENAFGGVSLADDILHHVAITFARDGNAIGYVDGIAEPTTYDISGAAGKTFDNTLNLILGARNNGTSNFFTGFMDHPIGLLSALPATEVAQLMAETKPRGM